MKLSLVVSVGKTAGQAIPITVPQFLIGRDPQCQLRPASAVISKRHCALHIREGKAFIKDFESTNGTLVNEQRIVGEQELRNEDKLKIGPLEFVVRIESPTPVDRPTPPPKAKSSDDEDIAAMLLAMQDEGGVASVSPDVPEGSTVLDMPAVALHEAGAQNGASETNGKKAEKPKADANTATAAEAILAKYSRRNRK
jgi:pSer/pThr/pTyr-binding forkhead associated (FHA) protein